VPDSVAPEVVLPLLRGNFGRERYVYAEQCESTQRLLSPGDPEGAVSVTEEQTEGRGRLGRVWVAPPRTSILCSVLLLPQADPARLPELTPLGAEAVADALRETGVTPELKAPNDVLVRGRKIAGILGEAAEGRVILGIGVNVHQRESELPERSEFPATSLALETQEPPARAELLAAILEALERRYVAWPK
jgi:BirA family transcriptional regulator, biotin operon repressor / biotin---[acetyl-CoA-carboxylase] ligase